MDPFTLLYNAAMTAGLAAAAPWIVPYMILTPKRRRSLPAKLGLRLPAVPSGRKGRPRPIWVHALSVGEALSAVPLTAALARRLPDRDLYFSTATATGFEAAAGALKGLPVRRFQAPFDYPPVAVRHLTTVMNPAAVVLVETDLWPNLTAAAADRGAPVVLANARMSDRSFERYRRVPSLARRLYAGATAIGVQTSQDRDRMRTLGIPGHRIRVTGNIKFDQADPPPGADAPDRLAERLALAPDEAVVVSGSTHPGEEAIVADAARRLVGRGVKLRLVCAPRDPARAEAVRRIFDHKPFKACLWSDMETGSAPPNACAVVVVDRIGLLRQLYGVAHAAVVGGSLIEAPHLGGHNPLEPAAHAKPVVVGPNMKNFRAINDQLLAAGGAIQVQSAEDLAGALERLLTEPETALRMGSRGRAVLDGCRGAVGRTLDLLDAVLAGPVGQGGNG